MVHIRKAADCSWIAAGSLGLALLPVQWSCLWYWHYCCCLTKALSAPGQAVSPAHRAPQLVCFFPSWLQDYYSGGYYPAQDPALVPPQEIAPDASFIDDEAVS